MAEVHIIGQIVGAHDFEDASLFAKWSIKTGSCWRALEGFTEGQTHLASRTSYPNEAHYWNHPIDVHYLTTSLQGWPKFELQIWGSDWLGKSNISAYGFIGVPARPGNHELSCSTWRPVGDLRRRIVDYMTGYRMHLVDPSDIISNGINRQVVRSISMGTVEVELNVIVKDFDKYGIDFY